MNTLSGISVSENGRYFTDNDGVPFFLLGDTLWELFRVYSESEALGILNTRKEQGFNTILVMLTGVDTSNFKEAATEPFVDIDGQLPWIDNDPLKPNEKYFRRIDTMIRLGGKTNQILVVGIYHQWHVDIVPAIKARAWGKWLGERYKDVPNLVWSMYPKATDEFIPVCRELAQGLSEGDGGNHLISCHPDPAVASSSFIHEEPWLAFNMIQTCIEYEGIPNAVGSDYSLEPTKPVVMAEGGYEGLEFGKLQSAHDMRKQAYWSQLSGGSFVYGHNESWLTPRETDRWLNAPGARDMRVFRDIITSLPSWWNMVPDNGLILEGNRAGAEQTVAAVAGNGTWIAAYLSVRSTVTLDLSPLSSISRVATWINPANGNRHLARDRTNGLSGTFATPADWEDAFLLIQGE